MTANQCTAKSKRSGVQCRAQAMPNGKCYHHGGASTGAPCGNKFAVKYGIYSNSYSLEEENLAQEILGTLDEELKLARIQLARALKAEADANGEPELMEIIKDETGAKTTKAKRRDYHAIINTLLGRIESLEKSRKEIMRTMGADTTVILIDAPDV